MCGRFVIELSSELITKFFSPAETPDLSPRYNVAPTQQVPVIREGVDGLRRLTMMRWGLVPSWSKEIGEAWRSPEGQTIETCAILTTTANATVAKLHDRMPVILHPDEFGLWLDRQGHEAEQR